MQQSVVMTEETLQLHPCEPHPRPPLPPGDEAPTAEPAGAAKRPRLTVKHLYGMMATMQEELRRLGPMEEEMRRLAARMDELIGIIVGADGHGMAPEAGRQSENGEDRHGKEPPMEGRSAEDRPLEDRSMENRSSEDRPLEERPAENRSSEDRPLEGQSAENRPSENRSSDSQPLPRQPAEWAVVPLTAAASERRPSSPENPPSLESILKELQEAARIADEIAEHAAEQAAAADKRPPDSREDVPGQPGQNLPIREAADVNPASAPPPPSYAYDAPILIPRAERHGKRKRSFWSRLFGRA